MKKFCKIFISIFVAIMLISATSCSSALSKIESIKNQQNSNSQNTDTNNKNNDNNQKNIEPPNQKQQTEERITVGPITQGIVTKITDGDTIYVSCYNTRIRIIGVNCPEIDTQAGKDAANFTASKIPVGTTVWLEQDVSQTDKYGRPLRYVWLSAPGSTVTYNDVKTKMLNGILVANGKATPAKYYPDTKYANWFDKIYQGI